MNQKEYLPIKEDFFVRPLGPLEKARLAGSRCRNCGEVFLGKPLRCLQCQNDDLEAISLNRTGTLHSYTIVRNRPPGDYRGPDNPFQPFAAGLVELPEGVRILAPLSGVDFADIKIGMVLELSVEELYSDEKGRAVVAHKFKPARAERKLKP